MQKLKRMIADSLSNSQNHSPRSSEPHNKRRSLKALNRLNLTLGDVRDVFEPYLAIFLTADRQWNQAQIGIAIAATNIAGIVTQTPIGALVDQSRYKRLLVALPLLAIAASYSVLVQSSLPLVIASQVAIGVATVTITPAINAITLGLVGYDRLEERVGKNEVFNRIGNSITAVIAGAIGLLIGRAWIFGLLIVLCIISVFVVYQIRHQDINQAAARADDESSDGDRASLKDLWHDRRLVNFGISVILFYFANAALLPLVSQQLAGDKQNNAASVYVSACIVLSQLTMIPIAAWAGKNAQSWGRKPLSLVAFAAVILRAVLYTLNQNPWYLIAVQALDGIASGLFAVLTVVIVADLTQGTGRFNLAQGMIQTLIGVGAAMSNLLVGFLAKSVGFNVGFYAAAAIAIVGFGWYTISMPETKQSVKS